MISTELRDLLTKFAESQLTVRELEDLMVPRLETLIRDPDSPEAKVVAAVELALAEYAEGIRSLEGARELVLTALKEQPSIWATYPSGEAVSTTSSSATATKAVASWSHQIEPTIQVG